MTDIIDEINITAKLAGLPSPVITSATDGTHSPGSIHGSGHALDLRCRERNACIKWAGILKQALGPGYDVMRSEEHTSELQSLMRNSYAVFCLKKKQRHTQLHDSNHKLE